MRIACLAIGLLCTALAHAEVLYRLPWPEGLSFMFSQAPGGRVTSHFTQATLHAVDIAMPQGVPILAARGGAPNVGDFEAPVQPELRLDTGHLSLDEAGAEVIAWLQEWSSQS